MSKAAAKVVQHLHHSTIPHASSRARSDLRIALCYLSYRSNPDISHTGLGNCALGTAKVLRQNGASTVVLPLAGTGTGPARISSACDELDAYLLANAAYLTHVVISALWVPSDRMAAMCSRYPNLEFAVNCHSEFSFLQVEGSTAVGLIAAYEQLEQGQLNFHFAGNSTEFCEDIVQGDARPCTWLPNLYYLDQASVPAGQVWQGGPLNVGLFGAPRWQKNMLAQTRGVKILARRLRAQTTLFVNGGRNDNGAATTILNAIQAEVANSPYVTLQLVNWQTQAQFVQTIGAMNLNMQVSNTESFNQVAADSISQSVPVCLSSAIAWAPQSWQADPDSPTDIAQTAVGLLFDPGAANDGLNALLQHNAQAVYAWFNYLSNGQFGMAGRAWPSHGIPLRHQGRYSAPLGHLEG